MAIDQRDVFLLPHPITKKDSGKHPFIVLSCKESNLSENTFVAVMITSKETRHDDHSKEGCHVRMHLLTLCINNEVIGNRLNRMKTFYFDQLMKSIGDLVFNYDFSPL